MSRSTLLKPTIDPVTDSGSVIVSLVQGEQQEFQMVVPFVKDLRAEYSIVAKVVEGALSSVEDVYPEEAGGMSTILNVRVPPYRGPFVEGNSYTKGDIVLHDDVYYEYLPHVKNSAAPTFISTDWKVSALNILYVQFTKEISLDWDWQPKVNAPSYGFFELSISEPDVGVDVFCNTWKPTRGIVEVQFSPTLVE